LKFIEKSSIDFVAVSHASFVLFSIVEVKSLVAFFNDSSTKPPNIFAASSPNVDAPFTNTCDGA
jgi:hypothetical protein